MTTKEQLILLLYQIRGATSKLEKLKLAALAWRTLRGLDPHERLVVAKELGLGGAEHLVEQLGNRGGLSPAALLAAIRRAEDAEPEELRDLLGGVMDPERRDELLAEALQSAGDWLAEQQELPPVPVPEQEVGFEIGAPEVADTVSEEVIQPTAAGSATRAGTATAAGAPAGITATATDPAKVTAATGAAAEAGAATATTAAAGITATAAVTDPVTATDPAAAESTILSLLQSSSSGVRRLRLLASPEHDVVDLSIDQLVDIVEFFPTGWSRRRALETLLRRGAEAEFEDAMELVRRVSDDGSRLWSVTALAGRTGLTEVEKQTIEAFAKGSPALERRVAIRLGRRRPKARRV